MDIYAKKIFILSTIFGIELAASLAFLILGNALPALALAFFSGIEFNMVQYNLVVRSLLLRSQSARK